MLDPDQIGPDHHQGNGGAAAVDGHAAPGDEFDAQSPNAVQQCRGKYTQGALLALGHIMPPFHAKSPLSEYSDRGHSNAVPPLVRPCLATETSWST